jgi:hypothetical protein
VRDIHGMMLLLEFKVNFRNARVVKLAAMIHVSYFQLDELRWPVTINQDPLKIFAVRQIHNLRFAIGKDDFHFLDAIVIEVNRLGFGVSSENFDRLDLLGCVKAKLNPFPDACSIGALRPSGRMIAIRHVFSLVSL